MLIDGIVVICAGYFAYLLSIEIETGRLIMAWNDFLITVLFMMFFNNYVMGRFGFYSEKRFPSQWVMMKNITGAVSFDFIIFSSLGFLIGIHPFPRTFILGYFLMVLIGMAATRLILYFYLDKRSKTAFNSRQILVVGTCDRIGFVVDALNRQPSWGHQVTGCLALDHNGSQTPAIPMLGKLIDFDSVLLKSHVDEVIFALPSDFPVELKKYLKKCDAIGVAYRIVPGLFNMTNSSLKVETIQGIPTIAAYSTTAAASGLLYKKVLDLFVGITGCIFFLCIYPLAGLAIKLDSSGPVLFKQLRVGLNNRRFYLYKFRSMVLDAESKKSELMAKSEMNGPIFKIKNDPRITRVGRFLRKTSLDEIPQFLNVLKGEMSLVGTRPPTPEEVANYEDWHRRRISMKPGITGMWQISGRNKITDFNEVVKLDLQYIDKWRLTKDIIILLKTVWVVLIRKGAI